MTDSVGLPRLVNGRSYAQEYPASDLPEMQQAYAICARENGRTQIPLRRCDVTDLLKLPEVTQLLTANLGIPS
jgi:hypothetical protein